MPSSLILGGLYAYVLFCANLSALYNPTLFYSGRLLLALLLVLWAGWRAVRGWQWKRSEMDRTIPLWCGALILSALVNQANQAVLIGLWFAVVYLALWFMTKDVALHLNTEQILDGILVGGLPLLFFGLAQLGAPHPRLSAPLENINTFAAWLVIAGMLAVRRGASAIGAVRWLALAYAAIAGILILDSQSRGAMLAVVVAIVVLIYQHLPRARALAFGLAIPVVIAAILLFMVRGDTGRFLLWRQALDTFQRQPITGSGPFTYLAFNGDTMQIHAHNGLLQIGAELGIVGLVALEYTLFTIGKQIAHSKDRWMIAILCAVVVHNVVDLPMFQPPIMVTLILLLAVLFVQSPYLGQQQLPANICQR